MKTGLNVILSANTIYVFLCSDNPDLTVFVFPIFIYVFFGFFRYYHKEFLQYLKTPISHEKNT
jgi:hypothetical protein